MLIKSLSPPFVQELLQLGADVISSDVPLLSVDDLADQVAEVLDFFGYLTACCIYWFLICFSNYEFFVYQ